MLFFLITPVCVSAGSLACQNLTVFHEHQKLHILQAKPEYGKRSEPRNVVCYISIHNTQKVGEFICQVSLSSAVFTDRNTVVCTEDTNCDTINKEWLFNACTWMEGQLLISLSTMCAMSNISEETLPDKRLFAPTALF